MPPFSPDHLAELRALIEDELRVLRRSIIVSEETSAPVALDQSSVGRLSRADAMQSQAMQQALHERELGRLGALESALRRIDDGSFGSCQQCGRPIPFGRLLVLPETRTCAAPCNVSGPGRS